MKVLGIDTHGSVGGAALCDHGHVVAQVMHNVQATHSEQLLPAVAAVLGDRANGSAPVDAVAVASGPGSFTGLRIGVTTAKTLAYSWNVPLVGVHTLQALAYQTQSAAPLQAVMVTSRRDLVFAAVYERADDGAALPQPVMEPGHYDIQAFLQAVQQLDERLVFAGDAVARWAVILNEQCGRLRVPLPAVWERLHSATVAAVGQRLLAAGEAADVRTMVPDYLRRPEAEVRWQSKQRS